MANAQMGNTYELPVWETITTAWEKVYGAKQTIWAALGIIILVSIGFGILEGLTKNAAILYGLICLIGNVISYFLEFGLIYLGIRRALILPIEWKMVFRVISDFQMAFWIVCAYLLMMLAYLPAGIIAGIGVALLTVSVPLAMVFFILATVVMIYVSARLILTLAFIIDKGVNAIDAIKASINATRSNVLAITAILILQAIIIIISAIPLGIGLIWTIPFSLIVYGLMYQRLLVNAN